MAGAIDDTLKHLTELSPQDWIVQGGWPAAPARVIDADIATIAGATDKVIRVAGRPSGSWPWIFRPVMIASPSFPICCCIIAPCSSGTA
ncbi:MAG TPA: hypothetical protein VMG10_35130 [Gemmataceae bacterium]|nr:hypothetical protein [Gemmataceae bacterium]